MNTVVETDVNDIFKEEIVSVKAIDNNCQNTDVLQRIWAKALNHVYKKDSASFETVAQFVLQHTESILFGFNWNAVPQPDVQQIEEHITQWLPSLTNPILRDKCQHILDHIHSPHSHPILNKLKRENVKKDWLQDAIQYLMMETGSTIVQRLKVYASFPDYAMIIQYAKNCWRIISSLSLDHPLSKAISLDEFYSILAYHLTSMYTTGDLEYIFQVIIDMEITETLKLIEKFPKISGEMEGNGEVVIDLLYKYHFNEFLRSTDNSASVDEHLMVLTNSYCQRYKHKSANEFGNLILDIASTGLNCPTKKLFIVLQVMHNECADIHLNFKLRLAYLGLSHDFNQLELKKADIDCDMYDIMAAEAELSEFFVFLSDVLIGFPEIHRECFLTAFTLNPSQQLYQKIRDIARSQGIDSSNDAPKGSIPAITNTGYLVAHNYNPFESPNCIMDVNEIDIDVREDLSRAITHPRLKFVSWGMPFTEFCDVCEKLMTGQKEEFTKNVVALANESLEYVDIDFTRFEDLPERDADDGIEKGYHMFLDDEDSSEEDDDKTMTSPEAAELIKEAEIKLKKKKMILKRKSTICKKMMKTGEPLKKILMKAPPRKIPRAIQCNRIDWNHIEELKEYFKEHSHLITATQIFNDAQTLIDKLKEMSANKEQQQQQLPEQSSTNSAMGAMSGDVNLNIIPIDPNTGVVVNSSSSTEHENFPNTSLMSPNHPVENITDASNIAAANLPTPSTSMTLPNPNDPVADLTRQILIMLEDVNADLRLQYRRQTNYLASIKRREMIKSGYFDKSNADTKPNQISSMADGNASLDVPVTSDSSNIPIEQNVNPVDDVKMNDITKDVTKDIFDAFIPNHFENAPPISAPLMNYTQFGDPTAYVRDGESYVPYIEDNKDFVNAFLGPMVNSFTPSSTIYDTPQSLPALEQPTNHPAPEQCTNHYDEIINMVATSYVDDGDSPVVKRKPAKKRKKQSAKEQSPTEPPEIQQASLLNNIDASMALAETYGNCEPNGYGQYTDSTTITDLDVRAEEFGPGIFPAPVAFPSIPVDGATSEVKVKKPRKPRGPNKKKKLKAESEQAITDGLDIRANSQYDGQLVESGQSQLVADVPDVPKKARAPRAPRPRVPRNILPDGTTDFTPNCKSSDLPEDVRNEKGKLYMDSIERAIQKVMAGIEYDIQPAKITNSDEMTMMDIDGVLENILNMNNGLNNGVAVSQDDCKATVTNHSRNDSTIEQDYTEDFDLDLTNDNLFQNGNEPVEASQPPVEEDKNKVTILSDLLVNEPQYFPADPSMTGDNCNSSNLINTSADTSGSYSSEFNGFAELILPPSIKTECQTDCAFIPSENCTSYTDISYSTKPILNTEINDVFVKHEAPADNMPGIDDVFVKHEAQIDNMNNGQCTSSQTSNEYVESTVESLPQHFPHTEQPQKVDDLHVTPNYTNFVHEPPVEFRQPSDYQPCDFMQNVNSPPSSLTTNLPIASPPPPVQKVNGITASSSPKSKKLTSSLRAIRKPNHNQPSSSTLSIKTKKLSIRLDRSVVEDFLAEQKKDAKRLLQPVVVLKRLEDEDEDSGVKRSKTSRNAKRKQNRTISDGVDKPTFKRRRDDMDDAEGSSGFTSGGGGSCYSSDSQNGSSGRDSVDTPPPQSTNGGATDSMEHNSKAVFCSVKMLPSDFWDKVMAKDENAFRTPYVAGKVNNQKIDNFSSKDVNLSSIIQSSSNCNLLNSVCGNANKLSYFKPIQTSAKFATLDTVLTHFLTLNKLASILKPHKPVAPKLPSDYLPNLLKSVPGVETYDHFLAPAHHRYQTVEIVQLAKQLLPATGDCNERDGQRNTNVLSTESTSKNVPSIEANINFREADSATSTATISRVTTPTTTATTKSNNIITTIHQQIVTPTTITPHIQKIGQPTACSTVSFSQRSLEATNVPTSRNNSVAVVFVKNSDEQNLSTDPIGNDKRSELTVIKNHAVQSQQKVVQLNAQMSQNQQNSPQLAKILNKPISQPSSQPHLLQILNAPPSRNLNNNLFTATATNGNIVSGGNSGNIMTFSSNNGGGAGTLPNNLYICKTDGKTIQLTPLTNNRLMTTTMSNMKTALNGFYINNLQKKTVNQVADEIKVASTTTTSIETHVQAKSSKNMPATTMKSQINTRSVYEENYAKFIQTASQKSSNDIVLKTSAGIDTNQATVTTASVQSNALPKFNHVFGKAVLSSDTTATTQAKTSTSTITLTVSDDDNVSVSQDAATQTSASINKGKHQKKFQQTLVKDAKTLSDNSFGNEKQKQQVSANHVIYSRQMPVLSSAQQFSQASIVQGINRMIQSNSGAINTTTTANKSDIKIIHQPMSSIATGMRISMPIASSSMQQIQTKLIRPVIQLPPTILRSTGPGEHRQQFLITTPSSDPSSNVRYENLIVTATASPAQSTQSSSNRNVDTSTLEQLREFDMVLEQVKERSTTTLIATPSSSSNIAVSTQSVNQLITTGNNQIIQTAAPDIICTTSSGQSVIQKLNLAYVQQHGLHNTPLVVVTSYCQPPLSSSSNASQKSSTVTSSITTLTSPKCNNAVAQISATQPALKLTPKISTKAIADRTTVGVTSVLPKYTSTITAVTNSISSTTPITTTNVVNNNNNAAISISSSTPAKPPPKLQEDEQTVQRIYNILAEYAEQLRNSPDLNNKPAPRRRCNIPSNTSTNASSSNASTTSNTSNSSKKRKSSQSSSSKRSTHDNELDRTIESEDSSGVSLHDQTNSDDASQHSLSNALEKSPPVLITSVPNSCIGLSSGVLTPIAARSTTVSRQLIFADSVMTLGSSVATSSTSTVTHSRQVVVADSSSGVSAKVGNETVLMPRNYVLPMSVIKSGGQQYAIVASSAQATKLLESGQIKQVGNELWHQQTQQQRTNNQQGAIVLQGFLNKNVVRTSSIQTEQTVKQPLKVHKPNPSQTFSNIEVSGSTLCRPQGNSGAFILQTIPTTMMSTSQSTILTNLVASDTHSPNVSAFARVPQQPKQARPIEPLVEEQQHQSSRGIIIIENVKEEPVDADTLVTKKRKYPDDDAEPASALTPNELKWSPDQYLDQSQVQSVYLVDSTDSKASILSSQAQNIAVSTTKNAITTNVAIDPPKVTTLLTPTTSCSDENLRFLMSNPYQGCPKTKTDQRNKHLRNNFILNTNGSSSSNRILLQQLCHERKQAAIERELRLQKSLSEECEDLGVGEPSTSDLFPEADLLFDTGSPAFDQDSSTPNDPTKQRVFFQTLQINRSNDGESDDGEKLHKFNKFFGGNSSKGTLTPIFLRSKDDTMMSSDFGMSSPYVQENSSSSGGGGGGTNDKNYLELIEIKKEETDTEDNVTDDLDQFNSDLTGDFDKLKNSMDWEGGPKKTYSKSSIRVVKQEPMLPSTVKSEPQPTLISISSPIPPLHQRRITQYHNKKKNPFNYRLDAIKSPKNDVIIIQRKRPMDNDSGSNNVEKSATTNSTTIPYIHNHSIGSNLGNSSSSFKFISSSESPSRTITVSSSASPPKIINHQMRRSNNQFVFDEDITVNGSNVRTSKQMKKR